MEPKIVLKDAVTVVGVPAHGHPGQLPYMKLWEQYTAQHDRIRPLSADTHYYGVYYPTEDTPVTHEIDFVAGAAVRQVPDPLPEGFVLRQVAEGRYAVFQVTLSTLSTTWNWIYDQWMPASPFAPDTTRPDLELYPAEEGCKAVFVYVSIREKAE